MDAVNYEAVLITVVFAVCMTYFYWTESEWEGQMFYKYRQWLGTLKYQIRKTLGYCVYCCAVWPVIFATIYMLRFEPFNYLQLSFHLLLCYLITYFLLRQLIR